VSDPGLYLRVTEPSAAGAPGKQFYEVRLTVRGKRTFRRIGTTSMSLVEARRLAASLDAEAAAPLKSRTFKDAADDYISIHQGEWGRIHLNQWRTTLSEYAYPRIGSIACSDLTVADVVDVLKPGWTTKNETYRRLRGRIETVILAEAARLGNLDARNPADLKLLRHLLPKVGRSDEHHPAPSLKELRSFFKSLGTTKVTHQMFRLICATGCRSGEVRGARWEEIQGDIWVIPAARMKAGREHLVPLTQIARDALGPRGEGLIFRVNDKEPSTNAMLALLKRKKVAWTVHGVRSTLRDFCTEAGVSTEISESLLAHAFGDKTLRAYARSTLIEQKRAVLERWSAALNADE